MGNKIETAHLAVKTAWVSFQCLILLVFIIGVIAAVVVNTP